MVLRRRQEKRKTTLLLLLDRFSSANSQLFSAWLSQPIIHCCQVPRRYVGNASPRK
jgi:hypothetical protein